MTPDLHAAIEAMRPRRCDYCTRRAHLAAYHRWRRKAKAAGWSPRKRDPATLREDRRAYMREYMRAYRNK